MRLGIWWIGWGMVAGCPTPVDTSLSEAAQGAYSPLGATAETQPPSGQIRIQEHPEKLVVVSKLEEAEAQLRIRAGHHTVFTGEIICTGCPGPFYVQVQAFITPRAGRSDNENLAPPTCSVGSHGADVQFPGIRLESAGPFDIAIPWHGRPVVIEVVEDQNSDGLPSPGERLTVVHEDGAISGRESRSGIIVDFDSTPMNNPEQVRSDMGR
jgi:hypothetical protein